MNMFDIFDQELMAFRKTVVELDSFIARLPKFNNLQRTKVGSSAHDIVIAGLSFKRDFEEANNYWTSSKRCVIDKDSVLKELLTPNPLKYLEASIKAFLFPIRAFQNNIYGIFLYLNGKSAGKYTSIRSCLEDVDDSIRKLINRRIPVYQDWFFRMKELRDRIKDGNSCSFGLQNNRFGVILNNYFGVKSAVESSLDEIISVDTFEEALKMSTGLVSLAVDYAKEKQDKFR